MDASLKVSPNPAVLIREVYLCRAIWDLRNPAHHNRDIVQKMWTDISEKLGLPLDLIKNKWKHLRDNFRSELKKSVKGTGNPPRPYISQWIFFDDLQFLQEQMMKKITRQITHMTNGYEYNFNNYDGATNDSEVSDSNNGSTNANFLTHSVFLEESDNQDNFWEENKIDNCNMNSECGNSEYKRQRLSCDVDNSNEATDVNKSMPLQSKYNVSYSDVTDDDFHFMMSLLPFVRKLDTSRKMQMRSKLQELICEFVYKINCNIDNTQEK